MALSYLFGQAHKLLRRRFASALRIALSTGLLVLGAAISATGYYGVTAEIAELSGNLVLSVFAAPGTDSSETASILRQVRSLPEVSSAELITPEQAKREFSKNVGEKLDNLLPNNPFPAVIKVHLQPAACSQETLNMVVESFKRISSVEDVLYNVGYAQALFSRSRQTSLLIFGGAIGISAVFLLFLYFSLRAETAAGGEELYVMTLLGASRGFVALPHILFAWYACATGIVLGAGAAVGGYYLALPMVPWLVTVPTQYLEISGAAVGMLVLLLSVWTAFSVQKKQ